MMKNFSKYCTVHVKPLFPSYPYHVYIAGEEENRRARISLQKLCCVLYLMNFWKPQKIIYEYVFK